jgi:hypothetical protein
MSDEPGVLSEISYTLPAIVASIMFVFNFMFAYVFLPDGSAIMLEEERGKERESGDEETDADADVEKAKESHSEEEPVVLTQPVKSRRRLDVKAYLSWVAYVFKDTSVFYLVITSFASVMVSVSPLT